MNRTDIPRPFYAAAGAGELAYQRLRQLPEVAARTAGELRTRFAVPERDMNLELVRLRESAQRGTAAFMARAATVQDRAATGYQRLVARGERLVAERAGATVGRGEPAGIEVEVGPVQPVHRPSSRPAPPPPRGTAGDGKPAGSKPATSKPATSKPAGSRPAGSRPAGGSVNSGPTGI